MPHEYKDGEVLTGTQEGPVIHGMSSGACGTVRAFKVDANGALAIGGLVPGTYDYIGLTYTGANLTGVVYKSSGSAGTTVATLAITYSGENMATVTKT